MTLSVWFWVLYVGSIVLGFLGYYDAAQPLWYRRFGGYLMLWLLVGMLGWNVFGPAVK